MNKDIRIYKAEAAVRLNVIEAEKEFLRQLLNTQLDEVINKIKDRLRMADIQIANEKKYIESEN